jgi:hypothetical protein
MKIPVSAWECETEIRRTKAVPSAGVNWDGFSKDWLSKEPIPYLMEYGTWRTIK